jgi:hypothetical protein
MAARMVERAVTWVLVALAVVGVVGLVADAFIVNRRDWPPRR